MRRTAPVLLLALLGSLFTAASMTAQAASSKAASKTTSNAASNGAPRLELSNKAIVLSRLPPILSDEEVRVYLGTGLTTTLALRLEARRGTRKEEGGAVVTVRFDLWDEVFHVAWVGALGAPERRPFETFEALAEWWRELRVAVLPASSAGSPGARLSQARLVVDVVPFSAAEARETQRWFSDTLSDAKTSSAEGASTEDSSDTLSRTFRLMMATSIQRRALQVYRYEPVIDLRPAGAPP